MDRKRKYELGEMVNVFHFGLLGKAKGEILWMYYKEDMKMNVSNISGQDYHMFTVKGARIDYIWRGRATKDKSGTVIILPPVQLYTNDKFEIPEELENELMKEFKPVRILVDTGDGIRTLTLK